MDSLRCCISSPPPWLKDVRSVKPVAEGSTGMVWRFRRTNFSGQSIRRVVKITCNQGCDLAKEYGIYKRLQSIPGILEYSNMRFAQDDAGLHAWLDMPNLTTDLYGYCCQSVLKASERAYVMSVLIRILTDIHSRGIVHYDIRPANIGIRRHQMTPDPKPFCYWERNIFLIDFSSSRNMVYPGEGTQSSNWNSYYASIRALEGASPTPSDDMESLAYLGIELCQRKPTLLPWRRSWNEDQIIKAKRALKDSDCSLVPFVFRKYLQYCQSLSPISCPSYQTWKIWFKRAGDRMALIGNVQTPPDLMF